MKILVTGSNGLLGQKIIYGLKNHPQVHICATARGENRTSDKSGYDYVSVDLTDNNKLKELVNSFRPDCIIHTAAMTNVDACELNPEECRVQNIEVVHNLLQACKQFNTHFIHLSTDFVFDGNNGPYIETDTPNPLSVYARSKVESELLVQKSGLPWCIIRTIIIYGVTDDAQRSNVVLWTRNSLEQQKDINVITDQYRSPTLAEDLADACISAAFKKATGIYHVSGKEILPIIDIAYEVARYFNLDPRYIHPVTTADLKQPAIRPLRTGFIIDKAEKELDYKPHSLREGLRIVAEQLSEKAGV